MVKGIERNKPTAADASDAASLQNRKKELEAKRKELDQQLAEILKEEREIETARRLERSKKLVACLPTLLEICDVHEYDSCSDTRLSDEAYDDTASGCVRCRLLAIQQASCDGWNGWPANLDVVILLETH